MILTTYTPMKLGVLIPIFLGWTLMILGNSKAEDTDSDGIEDAWEVSVGLDPHAPTDAFQDLDGDRVPNLWEFVRGTRADSALSAPVPDATVDATEPSDAAIHRYATLQEAYDSLSTAPEGLAIVEVKAGIYSQGVDGSCVPKKVAWLARGVGEVILEGSGSGMRLSDETVVDGFVFATAAGAGATAVEIWPHEALADARPEVRIVNTIIARRVSNGAAGAVLNDGADLWLVQCSVSGNVGAEADGIANRRGTLHLVNSIVWNARSGKLQELGMEPADSRQVEIINSVLRGTEGVWGSDPRLTLDGHLTNASLACLGRGVTQIGAPMDLHGVNRYEVTPAHVDLGAEQWVDADHDGLPDWWEIEHFGDLSKDGTSSSGGGRTLAQAYMLGLVPDSSLLARGDGRTAPSVKITFPLDKSIVR